MLKLSLLDNTYFFIMHQIFFKFCAPNIPFRVSLWTFSVYKKILELSIYFSFLITNQTYIFALYAGKCCISWLTNWRLSRIIRMRISKNSLFLLSNSFVHQKFAFNTTLFWTKYKLYQNLLKEDSLMDLRRIALCLSFGIFESWKI